MGQDIKELFGGGGGGNSAQTDRLRKENEELAKASAVRENELLSARRQRSFGSRRSFFAFGSAGSDNTKRRKTIG